MLPVLAIAGIGLLVLVLRIVYEMPVTAFISPEVIAKPVLATIHEPDPATFRNAEHGAMVMRGRYLLSVASCAMRHQGNGEETARPVELKPARTGRATSPRIRRTASAPGPMRPSLARSGAASQRRAGRCMRKG